MCTIHTFFLNSSVCVGLLQAVDAFTVCVHVCLHDKGSHEQSSTLEVSTGLGRVRVRSAGSGPRICGKGGGGGECRTEGEVKEGSGGAAAGGVDGVGQMDTAEIRQ